jgi:HEAT repeat protein
LAKVALVEEKRDAVLKSLRGIIGSKEKVLHRLGWNAYMHWMDVTCAPELRRIISKSSEHRDEALNALVELQLEEDMPLFLANLSELSNSAKKSLSRFGPKIESAVLEKLTAEKETFAQIELLRILEDIGTEQSVSRLNELKGVDGRGFKIRIDSTIRSINRRLERSKKEN